MTEMITVHKASSGEPTDLPKDDVLFLTANMNKGGGVVLILNYKEDSIEPNHLEVSESYEQMKALLKLSPEKELADAYVAGYERGYQDTMNTVLEYVPLHLHQEIPSQDNEPERREWLKNFLKCAAPLWTTKYPYPPLKKDVENNSPNPTGSLNNLTFLRKRSK